MLDALPDIALPCLGAGLAQWERWLVTPQQLGFV